MFKEDFNLPAKISEPITPDTAGLIRWLESKPRDEVYCWADYGHCLFAQFGEALGLGTGYRAYCEVGGLPEWSLWAYECIAITSPHTFGAALERTQALAASK